MGEEGLKDYSRAPKRSPSKTFPEEFACLPPIILDDVSTFWAVKGGNDLLAPYTGGEFLLSLIFLSDKGGILPQDLVLSKDTYMNK